ncbi:MAG TPA: hypothetical protein VGG07_23560 [Solirubrobacteraceae bacterium]
MSAAPNLDKWLPDPALRVVHRRESSVSAAQLWQAAREVRLSETARLGRLVRWRIPGLARDPGYDELFRQPPFMVLEEGERALVSGLVGRIWTLRRDYPQLGSAQEFEEWSKGGTARVVIANWASERSGGGSVLTAEARVEPVGTQGRIGVAAVRPVVRAFQNLVGSDGINAAVRRAERH